MAKASIHFDLDDPSERQAHLRVLKADAIYGAAYELLQFFREKRKYSQEPEEKLAIIEEVADKFNEILNEAGINIYEEYN